MQKNWYRLDTAALIFPAISRRDWCNAFRVSATLTEAIDPVILQRATEDMRTRHSVVSNSFDPMDCSLPGSSVHGIFQARILEWVAIFFSRRSSQPRD